MLDVTLAVRTEVWFNVNTKSLGEGIINVDEIFTTTVCNVECLTCCLMRCETCFEVSFNHIVDIGEVARLLAIAIDGRLFTIHEHLDKLWDNCCICSIRLLTTTKYVEVTHTVCIKTIVASVLLCPFLIATLGESVRRKKVASTILSLGEVRLIAIDR